MSNEIDDVVAWKKYMPKSGNYGTPTLAQVTTFVSKTKRNPELRLKVLSELRERTLGRDSFFFGLAAMALSTVAIIVTLVSSATNPGFAIQAVWIYGGSAFAIYASTAIFAIYSNSRSRHAMSWLSAYTDSLVERPRIRFNFRQTTNRSPL